MKIVEFDKCNIVFAKEQPEYLLAHKTEDGIVTSCWGLSWWERLRVLVGGRIFLKVKTFNKPPQPVRISVDNRD